MSAREIRLTDKTTMTFVSCDDAIRLLGARDAFVERMCPFDRMVRMKSLSPPSIDDFCAFAAGSAREWSNGEIQKISDVLKAIGPLLSRFASKLPEKVALVKTSGDEEFQSAYTRGNAIILPLNTFAYTQEKMELLLIHELFHVITHNDPSIIQPLYESIGFLPCGKIDIPGELKDRILTNPDTQDEDYYIRISFRGESVSAIPIISFKDRRCGINEGEDIFQFISLQLLAIQDHRQGWKPLYREYRPLCIGLDQVSGFYEQVGRNTDYVISPEEILADNFVLLVTQRKGLPSPEVVQRMERVLTV